MQEIFPDGAEYCIESAGRVSTIELGFSLINRNKGKLLFASHPPEGEKIRLSPHELISGKSIAGSWGGAIDPDRDTPILYSEECFFYHRHLNRSLQQLISPESPTVELSR